MLLALGEMEVEVTRALGVEGRVLVGVVLDLGRVRSDPELGISVTGLL